MNYNHRKPYIPLPPSLPRFALPGEAGEAGEAGNGRAGDVDPSDAAATAQRPALSSITGSRLRRVVRRRAEVRADDTEEVQVEDILLEAYAEDPPPPPTRRSAQIAAEDARASIAMAIAAAVPPPPAQSAAVDALLRASDPAFAPYPPQGQGFVQPAAPAYAYGYPSADFDTPSLSPVMIATTVPPAIGARAAPPVVVGAGNARAQRPNRAAVAAVWATVLVVLTVALGGAVVLGTNNRLYARVRDRARSVAVRSPAKATPVAAAASPPAPVAPVIPVAPQAPQAPQAPAAQAPVSVESLPAPTIAADSSLVTFPDYARGHRVFIDGRVVAVADGSPTKLKCGRHMVKIGSARKPRVLDFACGREVVVK